MHTEQFFNKACCCSFSGTKSWQLAWKTQGVRNSGVISLTVSTFPHILQSFVLIVHHDIAGILALHSSFDCYQANYTQPVA